MLIADSVRVPCVNDALRTIASGRCISIRVVRQAVTPGMLMAAMRSEVQLARHGGCSCRLGPMEAGKTEASAEQKVDDLINVMSRGRRRLVQRRRRGRNGARWTARPAARAIVACSPPTAMNCLTEVSCGACRSLRRQRGTVVATHSGSARAVRWIRSIFPPLVAMAPVSALLPERRRLRSCPALSAAMDGFRECDDAPTLPGGRGVDQHEVLHLLAAAQEARNLTSRWPTSTRLVSQGRGNICKVAPASEYFHVEDVHRAGWRHGHLGRAESGRAH